LILFCDTSALLKLYVQEPHGDQMKAAAGHADAVVVARIAWAEAHAAFARRVRLKPADQATIAALRRQFASDWRDYGVIDVTQEVVEQAGLFAEAFDLRGYDSVQLAAARQAEAMLGDRIVFACFDRRLSNAARALGMQAPFGDG